MPALLDTIREATTAAMRARERDRLGVLRQLTAAIKQREIDARGGSAAGDKSAAAEMDNDDVLAIVEKQIKQRRESAQAYDSAGRDDLASTERYEIGVLEEFMPAAADAAEVDAVIARVIADVQPTGMKDMGKVMAGVKSALQGRADMSAVSALVKSRLSA